MSYEEPNSEQTFLPANCLVLRMANSNIVLQCESCLVSAFNDHWFIHRVSVGMWLYHATQCQPATHINAITRALVHVQFKWIYKRAYAIASHHSITRVKTQINKSNITNALHYAVITNTQKWLNQREIEIFMHVYHFRCNNSPPHRSRHLSMFCFRLFRSVVLRTVILRYLRYSLSFLYRRKKISSLNTQLAILQLTFECVVHSYFCRHSDTCPNRMKTMAARIASYRLLIHSSIVYTLARQTPTYALYSR